MRSKGTMEEMVTPIFKASNKHNTLMRRVINKAYVSAADWL